MSVADVLIVGGGVSGLCCAVHLREKGGAAMVLEAPDDMGGRVRTDAVDGFLLDRGFQVVLDAYPEARRMLDDEALRLGRFDPGALVRHGGRFHRVADPFRRPLAAFGTLMSPIGTSIDVMLDAPETST